jgi:hypothetical protein
MDNPVENYSHNYVDIHTLQTDNKKLRISTGLYNTFSKLFHGFKTEKYKLITACIALIKQ